MKSILSIRNLNKSYSRGAFQKKKAVLRGVSFTLPEKSLTGFLGSNGAGKSTTIKCLLGLVTPDSGDIHFFGEQPLSSRVKSKIGFLPEKPHFYDHLTGEEFLYFSAQLVNAQSKKQTQMRVSEVLDIVGLRDAGKVYIREYSKGMYQRIGIAQAIIHSPELLILDEPMSDLDPQGRTKIKETLEYIRSKGMTIILSSHLLHDIENLCENIVILKNGVTAYEGNTSQFLESIQAGYNLFFEDEGVRKTLFFEKLQDLQREIDRLRQEKKNIVGVNQKKPSLEEAFVNLVGAQK